MADKKNIVIKVKYPATGRKTEDYLPTAQTVTVWNVKRIMSAAGILIMAFGTLLYFFTEDESEQKNDLQSVSALSEKTVKGPEPAEAAVDSAKSPDTQSDAVSGENKTQPSVKAPETQQTQSLLPENTAAGQTAANPQTGTVAGESTAVPVNVTVSRALLTYQVKSREPMTEIPRTVYVNKAKPTIVYYFTEVEGMNGRPVYHEWRRNDKVVTRYKLNVADDNWRTYSRMSVSTKGLGNWTVRLLADNNQLLNQQTFKVDSGE